MAKMNTGYSSFSSGPEHTQAIPTLEHTPTIPTQYGIPSMSTDSFGVDAEMQHEFFGVNPGNSKVGPKSVPFGKETTHEQAKNIGKAFRVNVHEKVTAPGASDEVPSDSDMSMAEDGPFQKLEGKLSHEKGVHDPAALAASIGRKKLGGKEYDHRISEGERHKG